MRPQCAPLRHGRRDLQGARPGSGSGTTAPRQRAAPARWCRARCAPPPGRAPEQSLAHCLLQRGQDQLRRRQTPGRVAQVQPLALMQLPFFGTTLVLGSGLPLKRVVLLLQAQIGLPAHAGWLRWELPLALGGALRFIVQPVRNPVGAMHSALRRGLIPRGVCQPMALPTSEVTTSKYSATAASTLEAHEPLPPAAEPGRRVCEGHELVDAAPLTV